MKIMRKKAILHVLKRWPVLLDNLKELLVQGTDQDSREGMSPATDSEVCHHMSELMDNAEGLDNDTKFFILDQALTLIKTYRPWLHSQIVDKALTEQALIAADLMSQG